MKDDVSDFIKDQINQIEDGRNGPRTITFHSATFQKNNSQTSVTINVTVENGDVFGILGAVKDNGGIWNEENTIFIPYPCACVEIEAL